MLYPSVARQPKPAIEDLDTATWRGRQWVGADCTAMTVAWDGTVLMFCGDTYMGRVPQIPDGPVPSGCPFTNNSLLFWRQGTFGVRYQGGTNIYGARKPYVPGFLSPSPGGFRWPAGAWVDVDNKVHAFFAGYTGNIFTGYEAATLGEVTVDPVTLMPGVWAASSGLGPTTVGGLQVTWGQAVSFDETYQYVYGAVQHVGDGYRVVVARRGRGTTGTPTYWDGATWSAAVADVAELGPTPGNSFTVLPHPAGGLLLTSCRKGLLSNKVAGWWAASPTGSWTDLGDLYTVPTVWADQYNYGGLSYRQGNMLRLLYNLNGDGVLNDYRRYGVRWAEVPFPARP